MNKLMEKIKCHPLSCFTIFFTVFAFILSSLFGSIKSDISQIRQEISKIYGILLEKHTIALNR